MAKSSTAKRRRPPPPKAPKPRAAPAKRPAPPPQSKGGIPLWVTLALVAFLLAVGITLLVVSRSTTPKGDASILKLSGAQQTARLTATGGTVDERFDEGSAHVASPTYTVDPPAGGDHMPTAAKADVYTAAAVPPDGTVVHAMEHGYVVVWYRPDLRGDDLAALRRVFDTYPRDVLIVPRASLTKTDTPVVATAWHHRLLLPTVAAAPLLDFTALYRNEGPEKIPH
jgi:hypothetical protein